jgi:DNA-binding transcriptional LysR family regulator
MEIHQLEYFLAVEKYRNFSAAALEINVTQSALSQQIKKLEDELGVKLFIRYARSVHLSPAGEEFLPYARRIVEEIRESREAIKKFTTFDKGKLTIGVFPNIGYLGLDRLITRFCRSYSGIELTIHVANNEELFKGLRERKMNVAFIHDAVPQQYKYEYLPIVSETFVLVTSPSHPLANQKSVHVEQLAKEQLIVEKSNFKLVHDIAKLFQDQNCEPRFIFHGNDSRLIRSLVLEGIGVAVVGVRMAAEFAQTGLSIVKINPQLERVCGLALPEEKRLPIATRLFRAFTLEYTRTSSLNPSVSPHENA